ncbi:MAG: hypothetical protein ACT4QF_23025 [Sporichthyaceae bacterium]
MANQLTIRTDADLERALAALTSDGRTRTEAVRSAIFDAERAARRAELQAWVEGVGSHPAEVAAARTVAAEFSDDEDDWAEGTPGTVWAAR